MSELCAVHKAAILVPSPNVAEDHQTHNAMALVRKDAAILVRDADASEEMMAKAIELAHDPERIARMEENAGSMARMDAAMDIAKEVYKLLEK